MKRSSLPVIAILLFALCGNAQVYDAPNFTASITDFRTSAAGVFRYATATLRFVSKSESPIILGFVAGSGVATDDRGNRYGLANDAAVRGIGIIKPNTTDGKFVVHPQRFSDARFEFSWRPGAAIAGSQIADMEITIRELFSEGGDRFSLGPEHLLHFNNPAYLASSRPPQPPPDSSKTGNDAPVAPVDQCYGRKGCYDAGVFVAEVTSVTGSQSGVNHIVRIGVRFRNTSKQPLTLAYKASTSTIADNLGNPYFWGVTPDQSATGIPTFYGTARSGSDSFTLRPNQTGNAMFQLIRRANPNQIGASFTHDLVILEMEALNSTQVRTRREYAVHFGDLRIGSGGGGFKPIDDINGVLNDLKDILGGKK